MNVTVQMNVKRTRRKCGESDQSLYVWPIRTEEDYKHAQTWVDQRILRNDLSECEQAAMDILMTLMEAFEHEMIDFNDVLPIDTLKFLMEEHGMNASDLGRLLGQRTLGSAILNGRRELSKRHIQILSKHFGLPADAFF